MIGAVLAGMPRSRSPRCGPSRVDVLALERREPAAGVRQHALPREDMSASPSRGESSVAPELVGHVLREHRAHRVVGRRERTAPGPDTAGSTTRDGHSHVGCPARRGGLGTTGVVRQVRRSILLCSLTVAWCAGSAPATGKSAGKKSRRPGSLLGSGPIGTRSARCRRPAMRFPRGRAESSTRGVEARRTAKRSSARNRGQLSAGFSWPTAMITASARAL